MERRKNHPKKVRLRDLRIGKEVWEAYAIAIGDDPESGHYEKYDRALLYEVARNVGSQYFSKQNAEMKALHAEAEYRVKKQAYENFALKLFMEHHSKFTEYTPSNAEIFDAIEHELLLDKLYFASFFMGITPEEYREFVYTRQLKYRNDWTLKSLKHDMREVARFKKISRVRGLIGNTKKERTESIVGELSENGFASLLFNSTIRPGQTYQIQFQ